jgi:predicted TIM-barrel fold metal-dependent hydrolase
MTTPWGEIEVSDAHVHFFSPAFFESLAQQKGVAEVGTLLDWQVPESSEYLADRWVVEMNHAGVSLSVAIASIPGDIESVGVAVDRHPERFRGVVMVNPLLAGVDIRVANALEEGSIHGVFLFPAMHRYSMQDTHVHSLLSTMSAHPGSLVYVHCGMLSVGFRKKLGLPSPFDVRFSNPIDMHGAAVAHPGLTFVVPHFGAGYLREALMLADMCPNVYFDTSSSNSWMRCVPWPIDLPGVFRKSLEVLGPNRLLFGSDSSWFPRGWVRDVFDTQVKALTDIGVSADTARAIFGDNLRGLLSK